MTYGIGKLCEDAIVAYLNSVLSGDIKVYPAFSDENIEYPCVIVRGGRNSAIGETFWPREIQIDLSVIVEASPTLADDNVTEEVTARDRLDEAMSAVVYALVDYPSEQSTGLLSLLQKAGGAYVTIDNATVGDVYPDPIDKRRFVSVIELHLQAQPA